MPQTSSPIFLAQDEKGTSTPLLNAYLSEDDPRQAADLLERLSGEQVMPILTRVVSSRLSNHGSQHRAQAEDITSDAMVAFLLHAEAMKDGRASEPILNFQAFVATLGRRACSRYFRSAYPGFHRVRNKARYVLDKYPDLARWQDDSGDWLCGLAAWSPTRNQPERPAFNLERPADFDEFSSVTHPADQIAQIFRRTNAPMRLNDLVLLLAHLWNVQDEPSELEDNDRFASSESNTDVNLVRREWLRSLWQQISDLPANQRVALLFNLRDSDGSCAVSLLVATGVASLTQIAAAVEYSPADFAALWRRLPLPDLEIAEILHVTRQQVINLRKCARERLARRMAHKSQEAW